MNYQKTNVFNFVVALLSIMTKCFEYVFFALCEHCEMSFAHSRRNRLKDFGEKLP